MSLGQGTLLILPRKHNFNLSTLNESDVVGIYNSL